MRATGIVRRIDDLGRVVIPKAIRRNMRLKEGDPLEIFIHENGVCFCRYTPAPEIVEDVARDFICANPSYFKDVTYKVGADFSVTATVPISETNFKRATAKCHPAQAFSFPVGQVIATMRARGLEHLIPSDLLGR